MTNESLDLFHQAFGQVAKTLPGAELPWLRAARRSAFEQFDTLGFPTTRARGLEVHERVDGREAPLAFQGTDAPTIVTCGTSSMNSCWTPAGIDWSSSTVGMCRGCRN